MSKTAAACIRAWRKNIPPTIPREYDALIELFETDTYTVCGLISYCGARGAYECEPCIIRDDGSALFLKIELTTAFFRKNKRYLRDLGIRHTIGINEQGKKPAVRPSTLPASLFPHIIASS